MINGDVLTDTDFVRLLVIRAGRAALAGCQHEAEQASTAANTKRNTRFMGKTSFHRIKMHKSNTKYVIYSLL